MKTLNFDYNYYVKEWDNLILGEESKIFPTYKLSEKESAKLVANSLAACDNDSHSKSIVSEFKGPRPQLKDQIVTIRRSVALQKNQTIDITQENVYKEIGVQNFKDNILKGVGQSVNRISVGFKKDADQNADKTMDLIYDDEFDAFTRNAELVIEQFNMEVLRLPMSVFDNRGVINTDDESFYYLQKSFAIFGGKSFNVIIDCPKQGTIPVDKTYFEFRFGGLFY